MQTANEAAALGFAKAITNFDRDAALAVCHPEIRFISMLDIGGRSYVGHAGIREYLDDVASAWAEWAVDVERVAESADGRVAIVMTMRARGKGSGIEVDERTAHVWTLRDGLLLRNEHHREPDDALLALGLPLDPE
jgi:ketosteroid isomerase-like protein